MAVEVSAASTLSELVNKTMSLHQSLSKHSFMVWVNFLFVSSCRACEELVRTLGFDWLLMFMEEHLHPSTVTVALWIMVVLLSNQSILNRFKEGVCGGGWLDHTDAVLTNKIGTVLGECRMEAVCKRNFLLSESSCPYCFPFTDLTYCCMEISLLLYALLWRFHISLILALSRFQCGTQCRRTLHTARNQPGCLSLPRIPSAADAAAQTH